MPLVFVYIYVYLAGDVFPVHDFEKALEVAFGIRHASLLLADFVLLRSSIE